MRYSPKRKEAVLRKMMPPTLQGMLSDLADVSFQHLRSEADPQFLTAGTRQFKGGKLLWVSSLSFS